MSSFIVWSPGVTLEDIEKQVILKAYDHFGKNKSATARALDISVKTLDNKFEKYDAEIAEQEKRDAEEQVRRSQSLARQRGTPGGPQFDTSQSISAHARHAMEPTPQAPPQSPVSVSQRSEVQSVLPSHAAISGPRKTGR